MARRWWRERGESGCDGIGKRTACGERSELPQAVPHCRKWAERKILRMQSPDPGGTLRGDLESSGVTPRRKSKP